MLRIQESKLVRMVVLSLCSVIAHMSTTSSHGLSQDQSDHASQETVHSCWAKNNRHRKPYYGQQFGYHVSRYVRDVFILHKNLFTWDSFKIATAVFPVFITARMFDQRLQDCFYDHAHKKNVCQFPRACHDVAKFSIGLPILFLGSFLFFGQDAEVRETAWIYLVGMPFVIFVKDLIKKFEFDVCLRPHHEKFAPEKRKPGGFPSGHLAEATYTAVLWGMRYGPKAALPLGVLAAAVAAVFINCNRHYTSQLIAGAGFGAMYAVAANKLINANLSRNWSPYMHHDKHRGLGVGVSCQF